jgi:CheY-like chemotaxis protein
MNRTIDDDQQVRQQLYTRVFHREAQLQNISTPLDAGLLSAAACVPPTDAREEAGRDQDVTDSVLACQRLLSVLIVDDCPDTSHCLSMLLKRWGHDVRVVYDGAAALEMAGVHRPDVLLVDIAMPVMDGYCLAQELRKQPCFKDTLLIAVTGYADDLHRALGTEAGFDIYLVKPVGASLLKQLLLVERNRLGEFA